MNEHLDLPVGELETVAAVGPDATVQVRFKGQRPDDKCLLKLTVKTEFLKAIHAAKERGGSVWVRFYIQEKGTTDPALKGGAKDPVLYQPQLVVRDILE